MRYVHGPSHKDPCNPSPCDTAGLTYLVWEMHRGGSSNEPIQENVR
jgi:hypothetical protein